MKKFISTLALFCFVSIFVSAQNEFMKFQGIARDADGEALANTTLPVKFYIYPDTDDYDSYWMEEQNLDTDGYGVFTASIGVINDIDYKAINFISATFKLRVDFDINGIDVMVSDEVLQSVPYARSAENGVPPGCIMPFAGLSTNIPSGWAICDGSSLASATYPFLYAAIGNAWGGDATNFNLPDLRGSFLRGVDDGRGLDPTAASRTASNGGNTGDAVGSYQLSNNKGHTHTGTGSAASAGAHSHFTVSVAGSDGVTVGPTTPVSQGNSMDNDWSYSLKGGLGGATSGLSNTAGAHTHSVSVTTANSGGTESVPRNYSVNYIIKL